MATNQPLQRRLAHIGLVLAGRFLGVLPSRFVFLLLVACDLAKLPGRRRLEIAYQPVVVAKQANRLERPIGGAVGLRFPISSARALVGIGAYEEACALISGQGLAVRSTEMTVLLVRSLFELGEFKKARDVASIRSSYVELQQYPAFGLMKSVLDIIDGDEVAAAESMNRACQGAANLMRPHQNLAARPNSNYKPNYLDLYCGAPGRLFDVCNFAGQRVTHVGHGDIGVRLFERGLAAQSELRRKPPKLSPQLVKLLESMQLSFDELRIIPEEWATQIGHLGMLDILFRMRELGWWLEKPLTVVRSNSVANLIFFRLFEGITKILVVEDGLADPVNAEVLSLQRWCGLNFNVFRLPTGEVVPWQEAGALAISQWEQEGRGHPLRNVYDRIFGTSHDVAEAFRQAREEWGMKRDDWYVCLHVRDASHYFELDGTGQTHRNSPVDIYLDAIKFITDQGGWVIKLGGPNSPRLPAIDRTIDYAFSDLKSDLLDIHLIRHAKAFIGTTSGLTNVAISFGIPTAVVNCITTDAQLWNSNVRFTLKPVRLYDGGILTQRQITSAPWRWRVFDASVLARSGARPENNTADEICGATEEVLALADGKSADFEENYDSESLWLRWKQQLSLPHYYGTSKPSLFYLRKNADQFLKELAED